MWWCLIKGMTHEFSRMTLQAKFLEYLSEYIFENQLYFWQIDLYFSNKGIQWHDIL